MVDEESEEPPDHPVGQHRSGVEIVGGFFWPDRHRWRSSHSMRQAVLRCRAEPKRDAQRRHEVRDSPSVSWPRGALRSMRDWIRSPSGATIWRRRGRGIPRCRPYHHPRDTTRPRRARLRSACMTPLPCEWYCARPFAQRTLPTEPLPLHSAERVGARPQIADCAGPMARLAI